MEDGIFKYFTDYQKKDLISRPVKSESGMRYLKLVYNALFALLICICVVQ